MSDLRVLIGFSVLNVLCAVVHVWAVERARAATRDLLDYYAKEDAHV